MTTGHATEPVRVSLLAAPESSAAVLYSLHELFSSVGTIWTELTGEAGAGRSMQARVVAAHKHPFKGPLGISIAPECAFDDAPFADVVVVGDLVLGLEDDPRGRWPAEVAWLSDQFAAGAVVRSVCTGSVLLAEAGLLDREEATTHWAAQRIFDTCYPDVSLRPERILVPTGPDQRIVTSGGSASWSELALHLIARFCGREEAVRMAKVFLLGDRSEGQLPFAAMPRPRRHGDAVIERCQLWIADHYPAPNPVARMVEQSGLAARSFKRRFRAATGCTPIEYVQAVRIEEAKQLLEMTGMPTDEVGASVGYEDPASFRRLFKRMTSVTPARYRRQFRSVGEAASPT